ncbi:hypothetical protein QWY93_18330 [Echinicola jeungdonensis]|uniref:hypothetical protein n=1 Tax=Echinicola jeungdonensis TaxID=709343 RepID=UPI0025B50B4D|nr:hypothetical protein [Echinicola jeungdonensis]MDN3671262.1 hypothetical protein [Echinicola jeungdonensis]
MNSKASPTSHSTTTEEVVNFLKIKENYPDSPDELEVIETHMSWVFLTDNYAYKLKKQVIWNSLDLRLPEIRYRNCRDEIRLNKAMAEKVYIGLTPVNILETGKLKIGGKGKPVDWLIKMKRLPEDSMLDWALKHRCLHFPDIRRAAVALAEYYRRQPSAEWDYHRHQTYLADEILKVKKELLSQEYGMPPDLILYITVTLLRFMKENGEMFEQRINSGKIIEAHGDLKPEHVCLSDPPVFIDCLEFEVTLKIMDIAEELSYLALGCEMLDSEPTGAYFIKIYKQLANDKIPDTLILFYKCKQALFRANFPSGT